MVYSVMKEKTGKGKDDDLLNGATQVARWGEKETVEPGRSQAKAEEEISAEIGIRVKKARESLCLSLFDLYLRTDIGAEMLSQIEAGRIVPPLGAVIKLAKALDLKMGYLISGEEEKAFTIVRGDDRKVTYRHDPRKEEHYGYTYESLAPHKTNRCMEPFLITLEPSETEEERSTHDGQEFIFVVHGEMEVRLGEEMHILEPGDSIYYDSTVPHLVKCHGKKSTKILAVLYAGK
jgi:quercetin dioxygenase-like cupin family protein/ribosome-binding protein aMBF1 (putative translation factor)